MAEFKGRKGKYSRPTLGKASPEQVSIVKSWLKGQPFGSSIGKAIGMVDKSIQKAVHQAPKDIPFDYVGDYFREYAKSRASTSAAGKEKILERLMHQPKKIIPLVIAAAGLVYGASKIGDFLIDKSRQRGFLEMMKVTPELKNLSRVKSIQLYNSLWDLNIHIAKNPVAAGSFVRQHLEMGLMPAGEAAILMQAKRPESRARSELGIHASKKLLDVAAGLLI